MLNPLASEFKPGQSDPKQPVSEQKPAPGNQPNERKKHSNRNKATRDQKFKDRSTESKAGPPPPSSSSSNKNKGNDVGSKSAEKKQQQPSSSNSRNKQQQLGGGGRRRSSRASISQAQNETALFEEPLKFITIPEAIEPVFRTRPDIVERSSAGGGKSDHGRRKSGGGVATTTTSKIVHAYERYIEWVRQHIIESTGQGVLSACVFIYLSSLGGA